MANTIIQIKRSTVTTQPGVLTSGEPAYSYLSDKLFLGDASGNVIEIGGRYYINVAQQGWNTANAAFNTANAAYNFANTGAGALYIANLAYDKVNATSITANTAYDKANAANSLAYSSGITGSSAYDKANAANSLAYTTSLATSAAYGQANIAYTQANTAYNKGNTAEAIAIAAYQNSNTKLAIAGGTITGNLSVIGSLTVSGNTFSIDSQSLKVSDPLIYLAGNNYVSDIVDIGFVANYVNATSVNVHTGLVRDSGTKQYYLFKEYTGEPTSNDIDISANNFTLDTLNANFITNSLTLVGQNAAIWIKAAFDRANTGNAVGVFAYEAANASYLASNSAYNTANAAYSQANIAYSVGNTAFTATNAAFNQANTAYTVGNTAFNKANTAETIAIAAFTQANTVASDADEKANAAIITANAAYAQANAASAQAANATFLTSGTVASARISGSYTGITGVGTLTAGTWNADTITVPYGGTGLTTVANNGILFGNNGTGALRVVASSTEGHVLQTNQYGTPTFGMLDGGSF